MELESLVFPGCRWSKATCRGRPGMVRRPITCWKRAPFAAEGDPSQLSEEWSRGARRVPTSRCWRGVATADCRRMAWEAPGGGRALPALGPSPLARSQTRDIAGEHRRLLDGRPSAREPQLARRGGWRTTSRTPHGFAHQLRPRRASLFLRTGQLRSRAHDDRGRHRRSCPSWPPTSRRPPDPRRGRSRVSAPYSSEAASAWAEEAGGRPPA